MIQLWEKHKQFVDEIGTKFTKMRGGNDDYKFVTPEGDEDICTKQQMKYWNIKLSTVLR
jgi:hypothetical protein